ncbi:MAG: DUF1592 domain-containing protein [Planctomycetaceae bacterium]
MTTGRDRTDVRFLHALLSVVFLAFGPLPLFAGDSEQPFAKVETDYGRQIQPLIKQYCLECHSTEAKEGELDLERFATLNDVRRHPPSWQKVAEMLDNGEMPPKDAKQLSTDERKNLRQWVGRYLDTEARASAGDPGPVVLRRLNNAEYTYTVRDLTGVELDPAREFPVDGAAGEGFTNTGNALVMSPALITKYLDAAKEIADHAVLLPDGFRFSPHTTPRDWTDEMLARIRAFYRGFTDSAGGDKVNLQGIVFDTNQGGRLPVERYLAATLAEREAITTGHKTVADVAREQHLNEKYLAILWKALTDANSSLLLDGLRTRWRDAKPEDAPALATEIARWQQALWRFATVGHIGKLNGPKAWMEPLDPITSRQEIKLKLPESPDGEDVVVYLSAGDAGDGNKHDDVVWERPRLVAPGRPDLLLRDVRPVTRELAARRERLFASTAKCLAAAADASAAGTTLDASALAAKHGVDADALNAWLDYLGISAVGPAKLGNAITGKVETISGYNFIKGWIGPDALTVAANSSDQHVRIPGNMKPHSVAVHPTPTLSVAVGWRSPAAAVIAIEGAVQHAHPECGNGVVWSLELRRGNTRQRLATGIAQGEKKVVFGPLEKIAVQAGDVVALLIGPRDGNHACDLTAIDLTLRDGSHEWSLARDVSPNILAGNPHADGQGNADVWHFFPEPVGGTTGNVIQAGSLLARWQSAGSAEEKQKLADELQRLLQGGPESLPKDSPDRALHRQLTSLGGPLLVAALQAIAAKPASAIDTSDSRFGLDPAQFGKHPAGASPDAAPVDPASLCVRAPSIIEVRLPGDLVAGAECVTVGTLHGETGKEGSVQLQMLTTKPESATGLQPTAVAETNANGPWTSNNRGVSYATPVVVAEGSTARQRFESSFHDFRSVFPAALCYTKIVPVDEVVTLTLFYREDHELRRLMLDEAQAAHLDRLWDELHYISHDALTLVDALEQLIQYATQDADPKVFEPLRKPFNDRADAFRQRLIDTEPKHIDALVDFAARAYRRPLSDLETGEIRALYGSLRKQELPHDQAFRLTLARLLVSPTFLYRIEQPGPGDEQQPVSNWELASRLSYFLWSSQPDDELSRLAASGRLSDPDILAEQSRRMLRDAKARRLATEFACQWLHIHDFEHLDEKSERHFPTFAGLRGAMYEESIRFFTDLFQNDGSVLSIVDADHTFLNEELAKHYGIPGVAGPEWRRVDGVRKFSRGGILTQATTLATQSGASRTSPILRGNWLNEVVLGEKLPRPPKNVPVLAETPPAGLTERQLIEKHSHDAACAKCHVRMDPFGFALENFDAIGRFREKDAGGLAIDSRTKLQDGTKIDGLDGLRKYLLTVKRDAFVRQFNRKLLGYALGRAVQLSDEPLLSEMQATAQGRGVASVIELIVRSRQFREIRGREKAQDAEL